MIDKLKSKEDAKLWRTFSLWSASWILGLGLIFWGYFHQTEINLDKQAHKTAAIIDNKEPNGKSKIKLNSNNQFEFTLNEGFEWPFAGIEYKLSDSNNVCLDLNYIENIKLKIKSDVEAQIVLSIKTWEEGRTRPNLWSSYRLLSKRLEVYPGENTLNIPIQLFQIPDWWRILNKVPWNSSELFLNKFCMAELIVSDKAGTKGTIHIQQIATLGTTPLQKIILIPIGFLLLIINVFVVIHLFKQNRQLKSKRETILSVEKIKTISPNEWNKIQEMLIAHFQDSLLNLEKLSSLTSIPTTKITKIIKEKTGLTFRSFLNSLRLTHAKKLLTESNEQVAQISKLCGYNSIPHFNRTFKNEFQMNPGEYRKNHTPTTTEDES
ncbi:AraC family transcriptional regulator [Fibrobacterales bacterium]|nr:AraC family transcriptional regulator [Fibrobacterales bacterium]